MKKYLICIMWAFICLSINAQAHKEKREKFSIQERRINEYYMLADSCLNNDNYSDAIMFATRGISEIKNIKKSKDLYYDLKMVEAMSYMYLRDFTTALSVLCTLENLSLGPWHIAKLYYNKSECYEELQDWSQSILNYEKCLDIIEDWDDAADLILGVKLGVARSYARNHQYEISNKYYAEALEYAKQNCNEQRYIQCCAEISDEFYDVWYSTLVIEALSTLIQYCEQTSPIDEDYCALLMQKGLNAQQLGNFLLAYDMYHKALAAYSSLDAKNFYENYSFEFSILSGIAVAASRLHKYDEANNCYDKAEKVLIEHSDNLYYWYRDQLCFDRALMMIDEGVKTKEASEMLKKLLESDTSKRNPAWKAIVYYNLGLALDSHDMEAALDAYLTAIPLLLEHYGDGVIYAKALNRIATILNNKEEKTTAMQYFESAIDIFRRFSMEDNYSFVQVLCNAAQCAYYNGEIGRAIAFGEEARDIQTKTNIGYVDLRAWDLLLYAYERVNNMDSYNQIYEEYRQISNNGLLDTDFIHRELNTLCDNGHIEEAVEYLNSINSLLDSSHRQIKLNVNIEDFIRPEYNLYFDQCMRLWQTRSYEWSLFAFAEHQRSIGEYDSAHTILKSLYDVVHKNADYLAESILVSITCKDFDHCINLINNSVATFHNQQKAVLGMTTSEKEQYWSEMTYVKNIVGACRDILPISRQLFDISLIYKNFLVNSDINFLRTLEQKGNEKVKRLASELRLTRDLLLSVDISNYTVDSLRLREIQINRQIIQNLKNLSDFEYASNMCCDSIASALLPNEVAIEIADYSTNDGKSYVAMLLRKDWQEPVLIELGDESDFLSLSNKPVKKLYDPTLPFSTELYELIWAPLTPYLNKSDIIYISPSGVISTLAVEALSSEDGVYVSDIYDIKRVSSTAYVLERENEYKYASSSVFGGVQYDSKVNTNYSSENSTWDSGYLLDRSLYEDIPYLPGTKKEAEMISAILANSKNDVSLHIGSEANEYVFKNLSGNASEIIHIATHGFYIPKKEIYSYKYYLENTAGLAMERSGLMLAGANDAWNGILTPGVEDGILTASEIAELDLSKTSLVVMSACETGLGEVTEDGIEGLQRAFKSAGVETLVMSLWKVDDKATEMLMEEFYKLLLKGYSKDDAFQTAKTKVRSKKSYSSPYYWASFIMLD